MCLGMFILLQEKFEVKYLPNICNGQLEKKKKKKKLSTENTP